MKKQINEAAKAGRFGDNRLLHVSDQEIAGLEALLGQKLPTNPKTGLKEAFFFLPFLAGLGAAAAPAAATAAAGTTAALGAGAAGAGLAGALGSVGAAATPLLTGAAAAPAAAGALGGAGAAGATGAGLGALTSAGLSTPLGATLGAGAMTPAMTGVAPMAAGAAGKGLMGALTGGLGSLSQLAPLALMMPRGGGGGSKSKKKDISGIKYEGSAPTFPGPDHRGGIDPEWKFFSAGGMVRNYDHGGLVKEDTVEMPTTPRMMNPESGLQMNQKFTNYIPPNARDAMEAAIEANKKRIALEAQGIQNLAGGGMVMNQRFASQPAMHNRPMTTGSPMAPRTPFRQETPEQAAAMRQAANAPAPVSNVTRARIPMQGGSMLSGRRNFAEGGLASLMPSKKNTDEDSELIAATVEAIQGRRQDAEEVIAAFVDTFGQAALQDLVARVQQSANPGDGMSDSIPANLSEGEFIVPADVVSGLGNGSTDAGAEHLYSMMDKVRGGQPQRQVDPAQMMPA